jgi:hypothetical protein
MIKMQVSIAFLQVSADMKYTTTYYKIVVRFCEEHIEVCLLYVVFPVRGIY